jgi:sarcosine oxidase subunit beta
LAERIAVVGGGVVGAASTLELTRRGHRVTLLEADTIAAGVTGGSLAALTRHHTGDPVDVPFVIESTDRWRALAGEFRDQLGIDVEYEVCGQLSLIEGDTPEQAERAIAEAQGIVDAEREHGLDSELITTERAREIVPALGGSHVAGATWAPGDAKINALVACRALVHSAARQGATVKTAARVRELTPRDGSWTVVTETDRVEVDAVLVACGPWSGPVIADHEPRLEAVLQPKRAQCCVTGTLAPLIDPVIASISVGISTGYTQLHQTRHGQVMFNTVTETADPRLADGRLADHVDHDFLVVSARKLVDLFPALSDARLLRAWAASEVWTPDQRFLIGPVGAHDGLFIAAGDNGVGFLNAPMVARAVASLIAGVDCGYDLSRYEPLRGLEDAA